MPTTEFTNDFSEEIWGTTYKYNTDKNIDGTFYRVAKGIAEGEDTEEAKREWTDRFYEMLNGFKVVPGGRILSNAGTSYKKTTQFNCYVGPTGKYDIDSLDGILGHLRSQSQTLKSEGGWGENFSYIRPRGADIMGVGAATPGAVKFMEIFDKTSDVITAGAGTDTSSDNKAKKTKIRKGAMMGVLDVTHPDIVEFITAKQTPGRLSKFNISVNCTDAFMDKVNEITNLKADGVSEEDIDVVDTWNLEFPDTSHEAYAEEWDGFLSNWKAKGYPVIIHKTVKVSYLWDLIMQSTYNRAEPGVLFLERANALAPSTYDDSEQIKASNPCIVGSTLINVADGRGSVSIKQLADEGKDVPVFCLDDSGVLRVRTMRNPRITGHDHQLLEVEIEEGFKVQCTPNHKFRLNCGLYKRADELEAGDSLDIMTAFEASIKDIFPNANSRSQDYRWLNTRGQKTSKLEHRLIAEHVYGEIPKGHVVHHIDYVGLHNSPDNLQVMSKEDHDDLHRKDMIGDKNPMRRAHTEWSDEKWKTYRENMSASTSGELNGRFKGCGNDEYETHAINLAKSLGRKFSSTEWKNYTKDTDIGDFNCKMRANHFGSFLEFSTYVAIAAGLDEKYTIGDPRTLKNMLEMEAQGYETRHQGNTLEVKKECETCSGDFWTKSYQREIATCSPECGAALAAKTMRKRFDAGDHTYGPHSNAHALAGIQKKKDRTRMRQLQMYSELKFSLGRKPYKKEWENALRDEKTPFRLGNQSPFKSFNELSEQGEMHNHKVVSVKKIGKADVYNGTVDDFHNFYIGGFEGVTETGKKKSLYINNLQCGEQLLAKSGGICCLSSINLTQFINETKDGFDIEALRETTALLVRFLDNINNVSLTPLEEYDYSRDHKRRIGIGIMGWGSALYMMKTRFGSDAAEAIKKEAMYAISQQAFMSSIDLAIERGMYTHCVPELHAKSEFIARLDLPEAYMEKLRTTGIRNSSLLSVQPTGNTGIVANLVSGGLEPVFMPSYVRTSIVNTMPDDIADVCPKWYEGEFHETEMFKFAKEGDETILKGTGPDGTVYKIDSNRGLTKETRCEDYGVHVLNQTGEWDADADWACSTLDLSVDDHVRDMKGFAFWIDSSMSKTVNLPEDYSFEDFKKLYLDGYNSKILKGLTSYRMNSMTSVLSAVEEKNAGPDEEEIILHDVKLPETSAAEVKILRAEKKKLYCTVSMLPDSNRPFALFVKSNHSETSLVADEAVELLLELAVSKGIPQIHIDDQTKKMAKDNNINKVARLVSLNLRHGVFIKNIVATLDKSENAVMGSFTNSIKQLLQAYIKDGEKVENATCLECGSEDIRYEAGCSVCISCGGSKCG